jgi:hypothetical protein
MMFGVAKGSEYRQAQVAHLKLSFITRPLRHSVLLETDILYN